MNIKLPFISRYLTRVYSTVSSSIEDTIPLFRKIIPHDRVLVSEASRKQFSKDEGHFCSTPPSIVLMPSTVEEVSSCLRLCHDRFLPVVVYGTGTGLEGGSVSSEKSVVLCTMEMKDDIKVNIDDMDCTVSAGITRKTLNAHLRSKGLYFTVDPGADASLCGMAATSASGTNALKYGTMKENVLNLEVVLADGTIINTKGEGRRARKSSAGFNLTEMFIGSEGTLGIITHATLRIHPLPTSVSVAICTFPSVHDAVSTVVQILQNNIPMARMELLDEYQVAACNVYSNLSMKETPTLFLEFQASSDSIVEEYSVAASDICKYNSGSEFEWSTLEEDKNRLWTARHNAYYAALNMRKGARGFTTDVCVPISRLAEVITETRRDLDESKLVGTIVGHVGDGNFHVILPVVETDEMDNVHCFSDRLVRRALNANGTCTGEHGIGLGKIKYLREEIGDEGINLMKSIKKTLDPRGILNPGKVLPT